MPTTARLVAALAFALVAALSAVIYIRLLPTGTPTRMLVPVSAGFGVVTGWIVMGRNVGKSYAESAATGLRTAITILALVTLVFAVYQMLQRSMRMLYHGPVDAVLGVFALVLQDGQLMFDGDFVGVVTLGGMVAGMAAEYAHRRWS